MSADSKASYPSDNDLISVIFCSLLGDSYGEFRGNVRFCFKQSSIHSDYLFWLHDFFAIRGLCNSLQPIVKSLVGDNGVTYYYLKFYSYTLPAFNWIYFLFYVNGVKRVPACIDDYLTPLALAVWIMDDGGVGANGILTLHTNCFPEADVNLLRSVLLSKYNLSSSIYTKVSDAGRISYIISLPSSSVNLLKPIVTPFMHSSMMYK
jgi:ubiquinol-cytochrome c reductase cytochrome b subunit